MGPVLLCARLGGMAVSAHRTQTRSVSAYRRPECLLKSRMCERHLYGSERAWGATFGEHPVYSTCALCRGSLLPRNHLLHKARGFPINQRLFAEFSQLLRTGRCPLAASSVIRVLMARTDW